MIRKYFPSARAKDVFSINYTGLYEAGVKGLIFDIDNTLVHHGDDSNVQVDELFAKLKSIGFELIFLSDNSRERIQRFNKNINIPFIEEAEKPFPESFYKALEILGTEKKSTIVLGDQIIKDIAGANNAGLESILVDFIRLPSEKRIGIKRYFEKLVLFFYQFSKERKRSCIERIINGETRKMLFCEMNPLFYKISAEKEVIKRHIRNLFSKEKFAKNHNSEKMPVLVWSFESGLIKRGKGIDITLQKNKAVNIDLASKRLNNLVIKSGETFSFWGVIGKTTPRKGYKKGRVLVNHKLQPGTGGGLCNLANTINQLILHSPLDITELHFHSDCLAPEKEHKIFSSGTSVDYNYIDFRFKNNTNQNFQLLTWCAEEKLFAELRCEKELPDEYELIEENRHYEKHGEKFYCFSKIYKQTKNKITKEVIDSKLIRDNKSEVMYDYSEIPHELIKFY